MIRRSWRRILQSTGLLRTTGADLVKWHYERLQWDTHREGNGSVWTNAPGGLWRAAGAGRMQVGGEEWRVVASPWHARSHRVAIKTPSHDLTDLTEPAAPLDDGPLALLDREDDEPAALEDDREDDEPAALEENREDDEPAALEDREDDEPDREDDEHHD